MSQLKSISDVIFTIMEEIEAERRKQQILCGLLNHDPLPKSIGGKVIWWCARCGAEV